MEKIDLVVATHPHVRSLGGLLPVLAAFPVGRVIADGRIRTTRTYGTSRRPILAKGLPFSHPQGGEYIELAGSTRILVTPSGGRLAAGAEQQLLDLRLVYKRHSFYFPGTWKPGASAPSDKGPAPWGPRYEKSPIMGAGPPAPQHSCRQYRPGSG